MDNRRETQLFPLPLTRTLQAAQKACAADAEACHAAAMLLADAVACYVGAVAVAQYSQALYTGGIEADPTLNRSLRSLRRVLQGQWLGWAARGLAAAPEGGVEGLAAWYEARQSGEVAQAYEMVRTFMVSQLAYTGEYGPQSDVSPRLLLEMLDQYRIRRSKAGTTPGGGDEEIGRAALAGLQAALQGAGFLQQYDLYAPQQKQLLMGAKATTPMPPISAPPDAAAAATLLLYPPGEAPDYTKRPDLQNERLPLFPLDPLLTYLRCPECSRHRVAALREVEGGVPHYFGLDPDCRHTIILNAD